MSRRTTRLPAALVLAAVLSTACGASSGRPPTGAAPSPSPAPTEGRLASPPPTHLEVRLRAGDTGPEGVLTFGEQRQEGVAGSTCWEQQSGLLGGSSGCIDTDGSELFPRSHVGVPRGTVLYVFGDHTSARAVLLHVSGGPGAAQTAVAQHLRLVEGATAIHAPPGRYTLEVDGTWPQGDGPLFFGLTVT